MAEQQNFIKSVHLKNFLSFGGMEKPLELKSLNVLIGPNASGKSNFIEAFSLLQAAPKDFTVPIRKGGGVREWLYKGSEKNPFAEIDVTVNIPGKLIPVRHKICFTEIGQRFELVDEAVENEYRTSPDQEDVIFFYRYQKGNPVLKVPLVPHELDEIIHIKDPHTIQEHILYIQQRFQFFREKFLYAMGIKRINRSLRQEDLEKNQSIISQRKDLEQFPELTWLGEVFKGIRIYREWSFGRYMQARQPQKTDLPNDFLDENCQNLGLIINRLRKNPDAKKQILEALKILYEGIEDVDVIFEGGTVQVFLQEGTFMIPADRLSDGTLRYLCLLAILCHPMPPPLVCIEEPEIGMHPDILPSIAKLLKKASERTQLVVATHSDVLVDELSDTPDAVIVCEKHDGETTIRRPDAESLETWLEKYSLGQLWRSGEIGGTRW